ncbi:MAG: DUF924 domain-containing protein [Leptolyngbya sp. SIO1D8]|nr:DUF924 domain-containing protein [Leptolyngbya sp. SIO1D8]
MGLVVADVAAEILTFWFGDPAVADGDYGQQRRIWFHKDPEFDQQVRERFLETYELARTGLYDGWGETPPGALALVVLLDQLPRNMFRGLPKSFEADAQALAVAQQAIAQGFDLALIPVERVFLYLPLEHSEDMAHQDQSVALFEVLVQDIPELQTTLDYAYRHRDVIGRFGRFPHRNEILGRLSTPEEVQFLQQRGSRF